MAPAEKEADMTTYSGLLANQMRVIRQKSGKSLYQIVERMAKYGWPVSVAAYRHWENGTRKPPIDALPYIAKALGVKLHELLPAKFILKS